MNMGVHVSLCTLDTALSNKAVNSQLSVPRTQMTYLTMKQHILAVQFTKTWPFLAVNTFWWMEWKTGYYENWVQQYLKSGCFLGKTILLNEYWTLKVWPNQQVLWPDLTTPHPRTDPLWRDTSQRETSQRATSREKSHRGRPDRGTPKDGPLTTGPPYLMVEHPTDQHLHIYLIEKKWKI